MEKVVFKQPWKAYLDFSEQVENLLYLHRAPSYYIKGDNKFHLSEEFFTGYPLGVVRGDIQPVSYYENWSYQHSDDSFGDKFKKLITSEVYLEFVGEGGSSTKYDIDEFQILLSKRLKKSGILELNQNSKDYSRDAGLYESLSAIFKIRYYGLIAFFYSRYKRRKEDGNDSVFNRNDVNKLHASIENILGYLHDGLDVPNRSWKLDLMDKLKELKKSNPLDGKEGCLYPNSKRFHNPELVATLKEYLLFCAYSGDERSPVFILSFFGLFEFDRGLKITDRILGKAYSDTKSYVIKRQINKAKILLNHYPRIRPIPDINESSPEDFWIPCDSPEIENPLIKNLDENKVTDKDMSMYEKSVF